MSTKTFASAADLEIKKVSFDKLRDKDFNICRKNGRQVITVIINDA